MRPRHDRVAEGRHLAHRRHLLRASTRLTCIHDDGGQGRAEAEHPVVRSHPVTGRPARYVNKQHSRRIPQLSRPESQNLLAFLYRWMELVENTVRWRWAPGDVVIWDERTTHHVMVNDTDGRRLLHRVTVLGDDPVSIRNSPWPHHENDYAAASHFFGPGTAEF